MKFKKVLTTKAINKILAHNVLLDKAILKKGEVLSNANIISLINNNINKVTTISIDENDVMENDAALKIAKLLSGSNIIITNVSNGRANLYSQKDGLLVAEKKIVTKLNLLSSEIVISTLSPNHIVKKGQLIGNVKIIPYAVNKKILKKFSELDDQCLGFLSINPIAIKKISLIITKENNTNVKIIKKIEREIKNRLDNFGIKITRKDIISHDADILVTILKKHMSSQSELILIYGATSIVDIKDIVPASIKSLKGDILSFGIPVDPGNLLLLGSIANKKIIGVPGCAKSPKINGFDWILEYAICKKEITKRTIAAMGSGGLLRENYIKL